MYHRTLMTAFLIASVGAMAARAGDSTNDKGVETPACPVMGGEIDFSISADTDQGPVFFCCSRCIGKFKADPEKFAAKVAEHQAGLAKLPRIQVTCPFSVQPINTEIFADRDGGKVYTCCGGCLKKIPEDSKKAQQLLAAHYTYQTKCPVSGRAIKPDVFTTTGDGHKVYMCCKGCVGKFDAEPAKYADGLKDQGFGALAKSLKKR